MIKVNNNKLKIKTSDEYLTTEKDIINKVIKDFNEKEFYVPLRLQY